MLEEKELQDIKEQVGKLGFPTGGNVETQVFCTLVSASVQLKSAEIII